MKKKSQWFLLICFLLLVCVAILISGMPGQEGQRTYNISAVFRHRAGEISENLRQGMEQAGKDLNVNMRFVTLPEEGGYHFEDQAQLINQEHSGGADAMIVLPITFREFGNTIETVKAKVPIVLIESNVLEENSNLVIQADSQEMGRQLGHEVFRHGNTRKNILVLTGGSQAGSIQNYRTGFLEAMQDTKNKVFLMGEHSRDEEALKERIQELNIDVVVALETNLLEKAAKIKKEWKESGENSLLEVYGIGISGTIISFLENDYLISVMVSDDYSMGYLAVQEAVNCLKNQVRQNQNNITFAIIDHENMYNKENQRLLFPYIK